MKQGIEANRYSQSTLLELMVRITQASDSIALSEVLSKRKLFSYQSQRMLFPQFLRRISEREVSRSDVTSALIDCAYDTTVDKFGSLPSSFTGEELSSQLDEEFVKRKTIDCRNYYRAILVQLERWRMANLKASRLGEELEAASTFQRMVVKHFYLSLKECRRSKTPFAKRYSWIVKGRPIALKRPVDISAREFKKWLEGNIPDPNPLLSTERNRIQTLVDQHFSHGFFVPWDEQVASQVSTSSNASNSTSGKGDSTKSSALATTVAHEKVERIDTMRPAIRELGKETLFLMISRIFSDIEDGIIEDVHIANDFGLSKATYSRFAGSDWSKNMGEGKVAIPDLWLNLAEVLSTNPDFMGVALSAGILPKLKKVLLARRVSNA